MIRTFEEQGPNEDTKDIVCKFFTKRINISEADVQNIVIDAYDAFWTGPYSKKYNRPVVVYFKVGDSKRTNNHKWEQIVASVF